MLVTPVSILITVALLALYGSYAVWVAITQQSVASGVAGVLAIVACIGAALLKPWSRYIVYVLGAAAVGTWAWSLYAAAAAGYFGYFSGAQIARSLAPGGFLVLLSCYCTYAVFRQFRARRPQAPVEPQTHAGEAK
jgi:hypothetical protein